MSIKIPSQQIQYDLKRLADKQEHKKAKVNTAIKWATASGKPGRIITFIRKVFQSKTWALYQDYMRTSQKQQAGKTIGERTITDEKILEKAKNQRRGIIGSAKGTITTLEARISDIEKFNPGADLSKITDEINKLKDLVNGKGMDEHSTPVIKKNTDDMLTQIRKVRNLNEALTKWTDLVKRGKDLIAEAIPKAVNDQKGNAKIRELQLLLDDDPYSDSKSIEENTKGIEEKIKAFQSYLSFL